MLKEFELNPQYVEETLLNLKILLTWAYVVVT